jgi:CRISPR system Cascade subunit CasB
VREKSRLIEYLEGLAAAEDRGALAALRRGAGKTPGTEVRTFPHVVPWIPEADQGTARAWPYFVVASLFALHPIGRERGGFGASMRQLPGNESLDARFRSLLNAHVDDVPGHLRHAVSQLATNGIGVNWQQLLWDLQHWTHPDRWTQLQWAKEFWAHSPHNEQP